MNNLKNSSEKGGTNVSKEQLTQLIPSERNREIFYRVRNGESERILAEEYGISRARINQIYHACLTLIEDYKEHEALPATDISRLFYFKEISREEFKLFKRIGVNDLKELEERTLKGHNVFPKQKAFLFKICERYGVVPFDFKEVEAKKVIDYSFLSDNLTPIDDFPISNRTRNALHREGIFCLRDLASYTEQSVACISGLGPKSAEELKEYLKKEETNEL